MDTHRSPLISVVIPAYNAGKFVAQAVQSVLDQTYPHHEIIVVDDGSTDETRAELRKFGDRLRYFSQQNRGPSAARNAGIRAAQGEYICFLDADDIWLPQKLEMQLDFMTGHQEIGLVFAAIEEFQTDGEFTRRWFPGEERFGADFTSQQPIQEAFRKLLMVNFIPTNTVMVRRECLEKAGLFDESLRLVEDRDLWLRIAASFPIACLPSVLCRRRRHGANLSQDFALALRSRLQMLEKNYSLFPHLAPVEIWQQLLTDTSLKLGWYLLLKNQKRTARQVLCSGLKHKVTPKALGMIFLSFTGQPAIRSIGRIRRGLLEIE